MYNNFFVEPLPKRCDDDDVDELWAEMVEYDGYISGLITRIISGSGLDNFRFYYDEDLEKRMKLMVLKKGGEAVKCLHACLHYMGMIRDMVDAAIKCLMIKEGTE